MPAYRDLAVEDLFTVRIRKLLFAPFGREQLHGQALHGVVALDPRSKTPVAKTLLHELVHVKRPMWSEHRVREAEAYLWRHATWREKARLYALLGKGKVWEGEEEFPDDDDRGSVRPEHAERASQVGPGADPDVQASAPVGVHDQVDPAERRAPQPADVQAVAAGPEE